MKILVNDSTFVFLQGGILNLSRRQKQLAQAMLNPPRGSISDSGKEVTYESSDDETEPLMGKNRSAIN